MSSWNPKLSSRLATLILLLMTFAGTVCAQDDATPTLSPPSRSLPAPQASPIPQNSPERMASAVPTTFVANVLYDQKQIWTAPFKAKVQYLNWIVPMIGLTAGMINADAELSSRIDTTGTFSRHANTIANAGLAAALGGAGGLYLLGNGRSDDHQRETGILGIEAATNSLIVTEALKVVTLRQRPTDGDGKGEFFQNGSILNSSFPSAHAMITWSVASVLAHEYPGVLTQAISYGAATTVSLARVYGKDHFPSDVIVGSALGWLIGRQAYASHHNAELPGGGYGTFHRDVGSGETTSANMRFSAYVPMDSWVYPAFDRLAALGVVNSNFAGLRPWTRAECARLLEEAQGAIDEYSGDEGSRLYVALEREFSPELEGTFSDNIGIDSVYGRVVGISGHPLTDDYHFASTIVNDYGRPFQNGGNGQAGFESSGSAGMLGFYMRGEYEHAPSAPGYSQPVQDLVQIADQKPLQPAFSIPKFDQFRLLDTYIALNLAGWQTSFGKQSLWLGPTRDPYLQSINAEPMYMFRIDQTTPSQLPWIFKYLGPVRSMFWVGKLTGQHFVNTQNGSIAVSLGRTLPRQPMLNGFKVNFKPTPNFEFGVGRTGLWGGPDFPITASTTKRSLFSSTNAAGGLDPGDRRSTFDFTYRIPGVRKWLTLYEDSIVEDEISPIGYPRRAAHDSGLYMSQVPGIPHLDARVEGSYTNLPGLIEPVAGGFFYWNTRYLDGYTNKGHIVGDGTVGRQGIALRAESTYWFASDKTIQLGYRSNIADTMFLQGGNFRDIYLSSGWSLNKKLELKSFLQYEYWNFPLLSGGNKDHDFTAAFQLTYRPDNWRLKRGD